MPCVCACVQACRMCERGQPGSGGVSVLGSRTAATTRVLVAASDKRRAGLAERTRGVAGVAGMAGVAGVAESVAGMSELREAAAAAFKPCTLLRPCTISPAREPARQRQSQTTSTKRHSQIGFQQKNCAQVVWEFGTCKAGDGACCCL
jgi:hypothetical protein